MSGETNPAVVPPAEGETTVSRLDDAPGPDTKGTPKEGTTAIDSKGGPEVESAMADVATEDAPVKELASSIINKENGDQTTSDNNAEDKPATSQGDVEMDDDTQTGDNGTAADESAEIGAAVPSSTSKSTPRRKSGGVPEHKGKKLNRKASKAKILHTDAKPGDYFYVRLKGFPLWPAIVCNEAMLPDVLKKSRPVTAAREDGTYRADYDEGGARVKDRTFPVMYLHTNEFGFIPNYDLIDIDFEDVGNLNTSMRKDLQLARTLAAKKHDLDYFIDIIENHKREVAERAAEREAAKTEKEERKAIAEREEKKAKKAKKDRKSTALVAESDGDDDVDGDVEMADATAAEVDDDEVVPKKTKKNGNGKRENEDTEPRPESVKKPRIKLNTPKTINGSSTPKAPKESAAPKSASKIKKKAAPKAKAPEPPVEVEALKVPEPTPEEKRLKKEKEILFLRHKLQKGLLTRDQEPKLEEMESMSEFVSKLEGYADLEVSIIRTTKINKVLKAILKLNSIPREEEYNFKPRSQALLDKWNKLLANEQGGSAPVATNGTSNESKPEAEGGKASPAEPTNGTKESSTDEKMDDNSEEKIEEGTEGAGTKDITEVQDGPVAEETAEESVDDGAVETTD